jgi:hypothetical protein
MPLSTDVAHNVAILVDDRGYIYLTSSGSCPSDLVGRKITMKVVKSSDHSQAVS